MIVFILPLLSLNPVKPCYTTTKPALLEILSSFWWPLITIINHNQTLFTPQIPRCCHDLVCLYPPLQSFLSPLDQWNVHCHYVPMTSPFWWLNVSKAKIVMILIIVIINHPCGLLVGIPSIYGKIEDGVLTCLAISSLSDYPIMTI